LLLAAEVEVKLHLFLQLARNLVAVLEHPDAA
jgi:hypothetical protein